MKKLNQKGFTLVELLAATTILSILLIIAVPNIVDITEKSRNQTYIDDAKKLVQLARHKMTSNTNITRPQVDNYGRGVCVCMLFSNLVRESEIGKGPEGGSYASGNLSFVIIKYNRTSQLYEYGVQMVETYKNKENVTYQKGIYYVPDYNVLLQETTTNYIYTNKTKSFLNYSNINSTYGCNSLENVS